MATSPSRRQRRLIQREELKTKNLIKKELEKLKASGKDINVTPNLIDEYNENLKKVMNGMRM